jgi:hypothetical protein
MADKGWHPLRRGDPWFLRMTGPLFPISQFLVPARGICLYEGVFQRFADGDGAIAGVELLQDVAHMGARGCVADEQGIADLTVGESLHHQGEHVVLSG